MKAKTYGLMLLTVGSAFAASATLAQTDARPAAKGKLVVPQVSRPARDSRGTLVISDPAVVPRGANEPVGSQIGISRDPKVIFAPREATEVYKICSKTVTDSCVQAWEPPRTIPNCPGDPECPEPG